MLVKHNEVINSKVVRMKEMEPLQIGVTNSGKVVMRTASTANFEIIDLTASAADGCWSWPNTVEVRLFDEGETVTLSSGVRTKARGE